jgi:hypothetical protein
MTTIITELQTMMTETPWIIGWVGVVVLGLSQLLHTYHTKPNQKR